jgi:putative serine/threonine protein kinase
LSESVPLGELIAGRAGFLLSYPGYDEGEAVRRVGELRGLGVEAVELVGRHVVRGVPVLGKGHVGVVVAAVLGGRRVALKIRRMDADRSSLEAEAAMLGVANGASVGPRLVGSSRNFLVMELVEGEYLVDWVGGLVPSDAGRLRLVLSRVLWKARRLDVAGLDHGELARAYRHVIVAGEEPRIIDFESASSVRRCANVTSLAQYLFFNRRMAGVVGGVIPLPEREVLIGALRGYRRAPSDGGFRRVLGVCGLPE